MDSFQKNFNIVIAEDTEEKLKKSHVNLTLAHRELQASMKKLKTLKLSSAEISDYRHIGRR